MEMAMHENDRSLSVNIDVLLAQLRALIADARKEAKRQSGQWMSFRCVPVGKLVAISWSLSKEGRHALLMAKSCCYDWLNH